MKYTTSDWKRETEGLKDEFSKKGVSIVFEGQDAKTEGNTIYLPNVPEDAPITLEELYSLRALLDHEAGHVVHTDFVDLGIWVDAHKDEKVLKEKHFLWNVLEDTRIERKVTEEYYGSKKHFKEIMKGLGKEPNTETPWDSKVSSVFQKVRREEYGYEPDEVFQNLYETNKEFVEKAKEGFERCESTQDVLNLVNDLYEEYGSEPEKNPTPEDYEKAKERAKEAQKRKGIPQESEGDEGEGEPSHSDKAQKEARKALGNIEAIGGFHDEENPLSENSGQDALMNKVFEKPEGNLPPYIVDTSKDIVFKSPFDPTIKDYFNTGKSWNYEATLRGISKVLASSKNLFRRALLSRENRGWESGHEQGRLDSKRYAQAITGLPNVRKVRDPVKDYDTAVHILIDCSGSMSGTKIRTAFACMAVLVECLKGTPVKIAISGHTTGRRLSKGPLFRKEQLIMPLFKDYDQSIPSSIKSIEQMGCMYLRENADCCAVRNSLDHLAKRKESKKILIVFSDGFPAHGTSYYESNMMGRHIKSIKENQERYKKNYGIETIGIGVFADHIKEFYPNGYTINSVDEFTGKVLKILAKELLGKD